MSTTTSTTFVSTKTTATPASFSAPQRKTMSVTQTYFLAHKARAKLSSQAARPDHNLRLLVGHANLLDTLMLELADAEREQESWFNQSVRGASHSQQKAERHVQWADTVVEEPEEDWQAEDADESDDAGSDASSDYSSESEDGEDEDDLYDEDSASSLELDEDEDILMADAAPLRRVASKIVEQELAVEIEYATDEEDVEEDDEADHARLTLTRSPSHSSSPAALSLSPPELVIEGDSDISEDDEAMPPSPPAVTPLQSFNSSSSLSPASAALSKTSATATTTAIKAISSPQQHDDDDEHDAFDDRTTHYYLPPRNPARLITALSVY